MLTHSLTNVTLRNYRHRDQNTLYQSLVLHASDLPALPSFLIPHLPLRPQQIYNSATRYCRTQPPQTPKGQWWSRPSPLNDWIKRFLTHGRLTDLCKVQGCQVKGLCDETGSLTVAPIPIPEGSNYTDDGTALGSAPKFDPISGELSTYLDRLYCWNEQVRFNKLCVKSSTTLFTTWSNAVWKGLPERSWEALAGLPTPLKILRITPRTWRPRLTQGTTSSRPSRTPLLLRSCWPIRSRPCCFPSISDSNYDQPTLSSSISSRMC